MKSYQHILIATNLTDNSQVISDEAVSLAEKSGATLSLVHVIEFNPIMYGGGEFAVPIDGDVEESLRSQARESLRAEGKRLGIPETHQWIASGATTEELVKVIDENSVDLIVLGNHEQHGLAFLLGSTANALLHAMPCDVLAVHMAG